MPATPVPGAPGPLTGRAVRARGEELAAAHLERLGMRVIARNISFAGGEIDLIALDARTLVFAAVKTSRVPAGAPDPLQRVRAAEHLRLRRSAVRWLAETSERPDARTLRFDAIGVLLDRRGRLLRLEHLEAAW